MLIHSMSTRQKFIKVLVSNVDGHTQSNSRPNGISSSNPALKSKHVLGIDTELCDLGFVGGKSDEMLGNVSLSISLLEEPILCRSSICTGLGGGEGLGSDEEEGCLGVRSTKSFCHVGAVNVGDEVKGLLAISVVFESFCDHDRAAILISRVRNGE